MKIYDKGPWVVTVNKKENDVRLDSDDFTHDASLIVYGDFKNINEKKRYAQFVCDLLNAAVQKAAFVER